MGPFQCFWVTVQRQSANHLCKSHQHLWRVVFFMPAHNYVSMICHMLCLSYSLLILLIGIPTHFNRDFADVFSDEKLWQHCN